MEGPAPTQAPHGVCFHPAPTLEASRGCWPALTQDVGWHAQQGVEHVVDLPVPLDHVCQLLVVHEAGGCAGVWGDPLKIMKVKSVVSDSATPWPVACQDSPSMGFSRPRVLGLEWVAVSFSRGIFQT